MPLRADQQPTTRVIGNLQWTRDGLVTATYLITPLDYGLRPIDEKELIRQTHKNLIQEVPDGTQLFGYQAPMDLADVLARMVGSVDLDDHDEWAQECEAAYLRFARINPSCRIYGMTIPVGNTSKKSRAADAFIRNPEPPAPTADDIDRYRTRARAILSRIGDDFAPVPVGPAFFPWQWEHSIRRGVEVSSLPRDTHDARWSPGRAVFSAVGLDEGAETDYTSRRTSTRHAVLKIIPDDDAPASYQKMITIRAFPYRGATFPGNTEFLSLIEAVADTPIDWVMRVTRVERDAVIKDNTRQLRRVGDQMDQRDQEMSFAQNTLAGKVSQLAEYTNYFEDSDGESEVHFTTVIAVGARTETAVDDIANRIIRKYKKLNMIAAAPRGAQIDLWAMTIPGARKRPAFEHYAHLIPTDMWAAFVPFTAATIGDSTGPAFAVNLGSGQFEPTHLDLFGRTKADFSGCIGGSGELGSGKSHCGKSILDFVYTSGGLYLAIDRTGAAEYEKFAAGQKRTQIVDMEHPDVSLDPLPVFSNQGDLSADDARSGAEYTLDLLLPLMQFGPNSDEGVAMATLLNRDNRRRYGITRMVRLVETANRLATAGGPQAAAYASLASRLDIWRDRAPVIFDDTLPPLDLSKSTVALTRSLQLPSETEIVNGHLYAQMSWRAHLGSAIYQLLAVIGRFALFRSPTQFGMFNADEAYHMTLQPVGKKVLTEFSKDGRKHAAGLAVWSHDPVAEFQGVSHNLIPTRLAFRHIDETLAQNSLRWLGIDVDKQPHLVKQLQYETSPAKIIRGVDEFGRDTFSDYVAVERRGEAFMRDSRGRIGRVKTLAPARPGRAEAINTTPGAVA